MVFLFGVLLVLLPLASVAQQQPPQRMPDLLPTTQEQLLQCQSLLRVKTDLPCRCDQVEHLAAVLLQRAEKAEQALRDARKEEPGLVPKSEAPAEKKPE